MAFWIEQLFLYDAPLCPKCRGKLVKVGIMTMCHNDKIKPECDYSAQWCNESDLWSAARKEYDKRRKNKLKKGIKE